MVHITDAERLALDTRRLPPKEPTVTFFMPDRPPVPTADLQRLVEARLSHWTACFTPEAVFQLSRLAGRIDSDERAAATGATVHWQRAPHDKATATLILGMEGYTPVMREVLRARFTLHVDESRKPQLSAPKPLSAVAWVFNAVALAARSSGWDVRMQTLCTLYSGA